MPFKNIEDKRKYNRERMRTIRAAAKKAQIVAEEKGKIALQYATDRMEQEENISIDRSTK